MAETIILQDGGAVPKEHISFCKELQSALEEAQKSKSGMDQLQGIIAPKDWFPEWGNQRIGKMKKLFESYRGQYYVQQFTGVLFYKGRRVVIHSRFDQNGELMRYMMTWLGLMPRLAWDFSSDSTVTTFQAVLVYLFMRRLHEAYSYGVYRQYRTFEHNDSNPRGFLDLSRHIRLNPMNNGKIAYKTREFTADNPVNRLILAAWQQIKDTPELWAIAEKIEKNNESLAVPFRELSRELGVIHLSPTEKRQLMRQAAHPITHHMHLRYEAVRKTAMLILSSRGLENLTDSSDSTKVSGMLLPMDVMWEFFLEYAVLRSDPFAAKKQWEVDSQSKTAVLIPEGQPESSALRSIKPDFCIRRKADSRTLAVLDAKYKEIWGSAYEHLSEAFQDGDDDSDEGSDGAEWENRPWGDSRIREDSFQVMSYMYISDAGCGAILFPKVSRNESLPIRRVYIRADMQSYLMLVPICLPVAQESESFEDYCAGMETRLQNCRQQLFAEILNTAGFADT